MKRVFWAIVPAVGLGLGAACWGATQWKMTLGGTTVSTSARVIAGTTYVPIGDVARALGMKVRISGTNITLQPAIVPRPTPAQPLAQPTAQPVTPPMAQPVKNAVKLSGLRGETLFSREWGFQVMNVDRPTSFRTKYSNTFNRERRYLPATSEDLIVVTCRLQNRTSDTRNLAFPLGQQAMNTALTDQDGTIYSPVGYDVLAESDAPLSKTVPAGTAMNFNLVFRVANGARVKELVYSLVEYQALATGRSTDFHVNLVVP